MKERFQILSLSGGGFRGLFTARVLAALEEKADRPIASCFDLICGTSIGGMIALGLGLEKRAEEIAREICEKGPSIFPKTRKWKCRRCIRPKYDNKELYSVAKSLFDDMTLSDSKHRVLIPVVNYSTGRPRIFKSWKRVEGQMKAADVTMACTAAPTYFPMWKTLDENHIVYLDGGLYANDPGLLGVHEAVFHMQRDIKEVALLSIGTMGEGRRYGGGRLDLGILGWGSRFFDVVTSAQEGLADFMLQQQLGGRYFKIDATPSSEQSPKLGLDIATKDSIAILSACAQSETQDFIGEETLSKWLEHIPSTSNVN